MAPLHTGDGRQTAEQNKQNKGRDKEGEKRTMARKCFQIREGFLAGFSENIFTG
jgi:hypothetical protein